MWKASRITADAASKMQVNAGLLLNKFSEATPKAPQDADIVCETTGDFNLDCKPNTQDLFADVNGAPKNTKEGRHTNGWDCTLSVSCLSITEDTIKLSLGGATGTATTGLKPKAEFDASADYKELWWIGDMLGTDSLLAVKMDNAASENGLALSTRDDGKGTIALDIRAFSSAATQDEIPMTFYILTKTEA